MFSDKQLSCFLLASTSVSDVLLPGLLSTAAFAPFLRARYAGSYAAQEVEGGNWYSNTGGSGESKSPLFGSENKGALRNSFLQNMHSGFLLQPSYPKNISPISIRKAVQEEQQIDKRGRGGYH